jgi:ATP-binding cassette subfamily B protein
MLAQNYSMMRVPAYVRHILDEVSGENRMPLIRQYMLWALVFIAVMAVSLFLMRKLIIGVSRKIEYLVRKDLYHRLLALDFLFFQENETGDLVSRFTNDLNDVRVLLGPGVMYIPNSISRVLLFLPVLVGLSGLMMGIMGVMLGVLVVLIITLLPRLRPLYRRIQEAMGTMNNRVWQTVTGINTIQQYTLERIETKRFEALNEDYVRDQMAVVKLREFFWPFFVFLFTLTELVILLVGGHLVVKGEMTLGQLLQFSIMTAYLTFPVLSLGWIMSLMQQGISAMNRINYVLNHPLPEAGKQLPLRGNTMDYSLRNLHYRYPGSGRDALEGIDLDIAAGSTIGITGMVGSGKTTLLNILGGLLKPPPGTVFMNGKDILDLEAEDLYRNVAVVSQEPFLFSRTVAENIALGLDERDMVVIRDSSRKAGLENEIDSFADGFEQLVGERGITLSGGQKQRVAIARALVKCAPVLLLDDPLSNIDARTETKILKNLKELQCYTLLVLVSHRVSALKHADCIYVMDEGKIVEQGTHRGLLKKDGLYARLARLQQMETKNV